MITGVHAIRFTRLPSRWSREFLQWETYGAQDDASEADFSVWVVETGSGPVVFDTGFTPSVALRRGQHIRSPVPQALLEAGCDPASVRTVVLSHLHYDHSGNLEHFPRAEVVVQRREHAFWTGPLAGRRLFRDLMEDAYLAELSKVDAEGRLRLIDGDVELQPGIRTMLIPGHTPGSQCLRVDAPAATVILTGDAAHYDLELENDWPFVVVSDLPGMYLGFDRLRALAADGARVITGHDVSPSITYPSTVLPGGALRIDLLGRPGASPSETDRDTAVERGAQTRPA